MKSLPKISIIFPTYNNSNLVSRCLKSIQKLNYPKEKLEVIAIDNHSSDKTAALIKKDFPKVKLLENKQNLGFAKAVNQACQKATGQYLFITNDDVTLEKNCLKFLIDYLALHPKVGVVGPKILNLEKPQEVLGKPLYYHFFLGIFSVGKVTKNPVSVDWVQGCGLCISQTLWQKLGGFDEGFFFTGEELDLCLRTKKLGLQTIYYPKAVLWHLGGAAINKPEMKNFKYFEGYKSKFRLIIKHANIFQVISALLFQLFLFTPYRSLILREKSFLPLVRALFWNLTNISKTLYNRKLQMLDLKKDPLKKMATPVLSLDAILFTVLAIQYLISSTTKVTNYIFISLIFVCIIFYLLIDHYSKIKLTRFAFKLKNITFFLVVFLLIYIPAIKLITIRLENMSPVLIVDGALIVEEASKKLLEFKNPYSISYQDVLVDWPFKVGDIEKNPTVDHFPYLPAIVIINSVGYLIFQNLLGFFDTRIISLIFLTGSLYLIFRFTKLPQKKIIFATLLTFNPLFISAFLWGLNDIYIVFFVLATAYALKAKKYQLALALFAIASAIKQLAWPLAPFLFFYLYFAKQNFANLNKKTRVDKIKFLFQSSKYAGILFAVIVLPFVVQNPKNFWDDTWFFLSSNTVLGGYGFSEILYNTGIITSRNTYFPFGLIQVLTAVPATLILLWRQKKNNSIGQMLLNYSLLLFLLLFFSRNLNHNYIAYFSILVTITFFVSSEEFISSTKKPILAKKKG